MRIRVLGLGLYGAHLAQAFGNDGHDVVAWEIADKIFAGATGNIPARLHTGQHYARSRLTRIACQEHHAEFMRVYGEFTHGVPVNLYAIAEHDSLIDFGNYTQTLRNEIEFVTVYDPAEFGLRNVEGAILTGERHVLVNALRAHFEEKLQGIAEFGREPGTVDDPTWDMTIDCTSCANDGAGVDRFEACLTLLLCGPVDKAVTICDGRFPSLYVWDEARGLSSLTSAKWTVLDSCDTWAGARASLDSESEGSLRYNATAMFDQMASFYPRIRDEYTIADYRLSIRAMPRSAADARLVDVVRVGERALRVRAGKLDAIFHAERVIRDMLREFE